MALSDDLLLDGTVTQDPDNAEKVIFNVPVYIKKVAIDAGGFEAFARSYGWTPTITDDDGNTIDNPMTVYEKCNRIVWGFVSDVFKSSMMKAAEQQAREAAEQQIAQMV